MSAGSTNSESESLYSEAESEQAGIVENILRMVRIPPPARHQPKRRIHYKRVKVQRTFPFSSIKMSQSDTEGERRRQDNRRLFYKSPFKQRLSEDTVSLEDISSIERQKNKHRLRRREKVRSASSRDRRDDRVSERPDAYYNQENMPREREDFQQKIRGDMWAIRAYPPYSHPAVMTSEMKLGRNLRAAPRRRCEFAEGVRLPPSRDKLDTNSASQPLLSVENSRPADAVTDYYFTTCPLDTGCNKSHDPLLGFTSSARTHVCPQHPTQDLIERLNRQQQLQVQHQQQQQRISQQTILKQQAQQIVNEAMLRDEINAKKKKENDTARAKELLSNAFPLADVTKTFLDATSGMVDGLSATSDPERPVTHLLDDGALPTTEIPRFHEYQENDSQNETTQESQANKEELVQFVSDELKRLKTD